MVVTALLGLDGTSCFYVAVACIFIKIKREKLQVKLKRCGEKE